MPRTPSPQSDDPLAIAAMILGAVSFTGLGFITGIPAIILASVALARKTRSRGLSLAGLIMGIISTVISIVFALFFAFLIYLGASASDPASQPVLQPADASPYTPSRV
jgi:hypothetical protein